MKLDLGYELHRSYMFNSVVENVHKSFYFDNCFLSLDKSIDAHVY